MARTAGEESILGDEDVGKAVAGQVDELEIRARLVELRQRPEVLERIERAVGWISSVEYRYGVARCDRPGRMSGGGT
jgi:hypothetical protein